MGEDTRAIEGQIEETREHMGDTVSALAYKADVPARMRDSAAQRKDAVTSKLAGAKNAITGTTGDAMDSAGDTAKRTVGMAQENPLGLTIGAVAVGFVVGSLLPKTRVEQENWGRWQEAREQRTRLRGGRARQAGGRGHHAQPRKRRPNRVRNTPKSCATQPGRDTRPLRCPMAPNRQGHCPSRLGSCADESAWDGGPIHPGCWG